MSTSFSLENLARIVHTDKMHNYAQECFARQVELVQQSHRPPSGWAQAWAWFKQIAPGPMVRPQAYPLLSR